MNVEGSIEQLPSGRWRVRVTIGGRRRTLGTFASRALAEARLRAFRREVSDGTIELPSGVTVAAYGADVIDEREVSGSEHRVAVKGADNERSLWRRHVEPSPFGALAIDAVDQIAVRDFRLWLRSRIATRAITIQPRAVWARVLEHRPPNASALYRRRAARGIEAGVFRNIEIACAARGIEAGVFSNLKTACAARGIEAGVFSNWKTALDVFPLEPEAGRKTVHRPTGKPISRQTQGHVLRIVRAVLAHAVADGVLATNPAAGVRPAPSATRGRDFNEDWLRQNEIDALLACERISAFNRAAYAFLLGTALRLNDAKSVEIAHVHLDAEVPGPHVQVWISKADGRFHRVPILPWLAPILRAHVATLPKGSRWLFPTREGLRYHKDHDFGWAEKRESGRPRRPGALELAGVARRIRAHDLRGTTATHLALGTWGRRWSLLEVQTMLAHTDQRVTERYVRRAMDMLAEAARATTEGPRMGPLSVHVGPRSIAENVAGSTGFEPVTFGSGGAREPEGSQALTSGVDRLVDRSDLRSGAARQAARAVLETADPSSMVALALAVLADATTAPADAVRLALEVREPGTPHRARRAIELAELVLEHTADETAADGRQA